MMLEEVSQMEERIISSEAGDEDVSFETSLRPTTLKQYIGQDKVKENLKVFIEAAKLREETLRSCSSIWSSRAWENDTCNYYCQ